MARMSRPYRRAKKRAPAISSNLIPTLTSLLEATDASLIDRVVGEPGAGERLLATNTLKSLFHWSPYAIARRAGLDERQATCLIAAMLLGRRMSMADFRERERMKSDIDIAAWATAMMRSLLHEEIWVVAMDGNYGVLGSRCVARGGRHGVSTDVPTVLRHALEMGACSFFLAHNHPSGDTTPSEEDIDLTVSVFQASRFVMMPLFDHVIVAPGADARYIHPEDYLYLDEEEEAG